MKKTLSLLLALLLALCYAGTAVVIGHIGNRIDKKVRILR